MKKYIAINILAVFIYSIGLSQNRQQIDSLKLELNKSKHDTSSVRNMVVLTYLYWLNQPDSALFFAQKAVGLARQIKYPKGESDALTHMGLVFTTIGNRPKALELFLKALQVAESGNVYGFVRAHALYNIGESYGHFGDNSKAINCNSQDLI